MVTNIELARMFFPQIKEGEEGKIEKSSDEKEKRIREYEKRRMNYLAMKFLNDDDGEERKDYVNSPRRNYYQPPNPLYHPSYFDKYYFDDHSLKIKSNDYSREIKSISKKYFHHIDDDITKSQKKLEKLLKELLGEKYERDYNPKKYLRIKNFEEYHRSNNPNITEIYKNSPPYTFDDLKKQYLNELIEKVLKKRGLIMKE